MEIQNLHRDALHSLMFDTPGDGRGAPVGYQIRVSVWESLKVMAKVDTGHTEGNSEKEEGRDAESASQADGNR